MNQVTKKQHYVWRYYLAPWTNDYSVTGQIACLRNKKIFITSLTNIAHENYFYAAKRLSEAEKDLFTAIANRNASNIQKEINQKWLGLYCAPFELANMVTPLLPFADQQNKGQSDWALKNMAIEHIEKLHAIIEATGIDFLKQLRQGDTSFWRDKDSRDKFTFFLCNQYFRTKRMRNGIIGAFRQASEEKGYFSDINPDNIWVPLSLTFATNVGVYIAQEFSLSLLHANGKCFIAGDQPVLNTYSTFDASVPANVELYYPITPELAVLLTRNPLYSNGDKFDISEDEVAKYNVLEFRASGEEVFAKEKVQLEAFVIE